MFEKARHHVWLETVINFLYFLLISPYRFKYNLKSATYSLKTGTCSKILSGSLHILGVLFTLFGLHTRATARGIQNPRCVFHVAVSYSRFIIYYALLFTLWTRRDHFQEFFTSTSIISSWTNHQNSNSASSKRAKWLTRLLCSLMIPAAIVMEILNYTDHLGFYQYILATFSRPAGPENFQKMLGFHQEAKMIVDPPESSLMPMPQESQLAPNFSIVQNFPHHRPPPHPPHFSVGDILLTVIFDMFKIYIRACNHFALLFSILAAITFHQAANNFINSVSQERNQDQAILKYINFCKFTNCLNQMCGGIVLATVVCSPPFFIVYLIGTFSDFGFNGPRVVFYSLMYCCLYILAARASNKVTEFKEWIIENGEDDNENESQLFAIFVELSENPVGLEGIRCFTLTYGFLSKMFALIISFTIVLMQFETTPANATTSIPCE